MTSKLWIVFYFLRAKALQWVLQDRARLEKWQRFRLQRFLKWVRKNSPFYRDQWAGLSLKEWESFPIIDKSQMMENFSQLNTKGIVREEAFQLALESERTRNFSPTLGEITVGLSSGTSGNRGLFLVSPQERYAHAGAILSKVLSGLPIQKQRIAFFLRANSNLYSTSNSRFLKFEFFDLLGLLEDHIQGLNALQPTLLFAPPSHLRTLAHAVRAGVLSIQPLRIFSVAETLDPLDEKAISEAFGQKVHQVYQCTEGFLGMTCPEGTLHLNEEFVTLQKEWLDQESGKFIPIVTDFMRTTQPIVRYRLNDILTLKKDLCACGSKALAIEAIEGRSDDMIYFHSENKPSQAQAVFPDFVRRAILMASEGIEEYRVVQSSIGTLEIALKIKAGIDLEEVQRRIESELKDLAVQVRTIAPEVQFHAEFPALGLTKLRRVESRLSLSEKRRLQGILPQGLTRSRSSARSQWQGTIRVSG